MLSNINLWSIQKIWMWLIKYVKVRTWWRECVCVDENLHIDLFMQFSGVYIKAHISLLRQLFYSNNKTFLQMYLNEQERY